MTQFTRVSALASRKAMTAAMIGAITLPAASAVAGSAAPTYGVLAAFGTLGKNYPTGGVQVDPASPVPGALIAGSGRGPSSPGAIVMLSPPASGSTWSIVTVHSLVASEGIWPQGKMLPYSGTLLGAANQGGANGGGTLFQLTPNGKGYSFAKLMDFGSAACPVTRPHGNLIIGYGGGIYGNSGIDTAGSVGQGAVYQLLRPSENGGIWGCKVIQQYNGGLDGKTPQGLYAAADGTLVVNVLAGSAHGYGEVDVLSPPASAGGTWQRSVVHAFGSSRNDGKYPQTVMVPDGNGSLLGLTTGGGPYNAGTLFKLTPPTAAGGSWTYQTQYVFAGGASNPAQPRGPLVQTAPGVFYGASNLGGAGNVGTVFKLTHNSAGWTSSVVHAFAGGISDGAKSSGGVYLAPNGVAYGTTRQGGPNNVGVAYQVTSP